MYKVNNPLVTILVPCYNDGKYIKKALDDLLDQSYSNTQIIISDNCSTDNSRDIIDQFLENKKIKVFYQKKNIGAISNFNFLLNQVKSEYFIFAASDDKWHNDFLKILVGELEKSPCLYAFGSYVEIDENDNLLGKVINLNISGKSGSDRIYNFFFKNDSRRDAFFYGLMKFDLKKYWKINKFVMVSNIIWRTGYPPLLKLLSLGECKFVKTDFPLWFNRIHINSPPRHSKMSSNFIAAWFFLNCNLINFYFFSIIKIFSFKKPFSLLLSLYFLSEYTVKESILIQKTAIKKLLKFLFSPLFC